MKTINQDTGKRERSERALARLASIGTQANLCLDEKIDQVLKLVTQYFGIPNGVVSTRGGSLLTIRNAVSPHDWLTPHIPKMQVSRLFSPELTKPYIKRKTVAVIKFVSPANIAPANQQIDRLV